MTTSMNQLQAERHRDRAFVDNRKLPGRDPELIVLVEGQVDSSGNTALVTALCRKPVAKTDTSFLILLFQPLDHPVKIGLNTLGLIELLIFSESLFLGLFT